MHPRAQQLIEELRMLPHPEGGYFTEIYRSALAVQRADGARRSAQTSILFLLVQGQFSQWHRVAADETWHYHEGSPLHLHVANPAITTHTLGPVGHNSRPVQVVPAHAWQAARPLGEFALVSCNVAPGFEFADFELIDALPAAERPNLPAVPEL